MSDEKLLTQNPRVREIRIEALKVDLLLRPLPVSVSRTIAKGLKGITDTINKVGRSSGMLQRELEAVSLEFRTGKLETDVYFKRTNDLVEKLVTATPDELDWQTAEAVVKVFAQLMSFYGHTFSTDTIEEKVTLSEIVDVLQEQVDITGEGDFLLGPLRVVLRILKQVPQEMKNLETGITSAMEQKRTE